MIIPRVHEFLDFCKFRGAHFGATLPHLDPFPQKMNQGTSGLGAKMGFAQILRKNTECQGKDMNAFIPDALLGSIGIGFFGTNLVLKMDETS